MTLPDRLIIADPGLIHAGGHNLSYSQAVAEAAMARRVSALILANRKSLVDDMGAVQCRPTFRALYQKSGQPSVLRDLLYGVASHLPGAVQPAATRGLQSIRRAAQRFSTPRDTFGKELATALVGLGGAERDLVLLHTVSAANLHGLAAALPRHAVGGIAVVLRRTPEEMDSDDAAPQSIRVVIRRLILHFGHRLHVFADTPNLASLYQRLLSTPVATIPLPVVAPAVRHGPLAGSPHLVFAGGARAEKGYHLLPSLAERLHGRVRLSIQSGPVGSGTDPLVQKAHRALRQMAGPDLVLLERSLDPFEYLNLIGNADLMLLPYSADAYGPRSSGILAEARALGVPAIVPRGTWMAEAAGPLPAVIFDGPAGFIPTVESALVRLPELTVALRQAAPSWRAMHSPDTVVRALIQSLTCHSDHRPDSPAGLVPLHSPPV